MSRDHQRTPTNLAGAATDRAARRGGLPITQVHADDSSNDSIAGRHRHTGTTSEWPWLACCGRPATSQSAWTKLRIRRLQVRILPSAPRFSQVRGLTANRGPASYRLYCNQYCNAGLMSLAVPPRQPSHRSPMNSPRRRPIATPTANKNRSSRGVTEVTRVGVEEALDQEPGSHLGTIHLRGTHGGQRRAELSRRSWLGSRRYGDAEARQVGDGGPAVSDGVAAGVHGEGASRHRLDDGDVAEPGG